MRFWILQSLRFSSQPEKIDNKILEEVNGAEKQKQKQKHAATDKPKAKGRKSKKLSLE